MASSTSSAGRVLCSIDSTELVAKTSLKCLGFWWSWDLSAKVASIKKSRRAFFMHNSKVFQGKLNPLSGKALFEVCIIPILLYGCENWVLTTTLLTQLERFQSEIGRRILQLSRNHSSISCRIALRWPSVAARIFISKLCYILRLRTFELSDNVASTLFQSSNPLHLSLVKECRFLEDHLGLANYTHQVLCGEYDGAKKHLHNCILEEEWRHTIETAKNKRSTEFVANIASERSWLQLWDMMLEQGNEGTAALQAFFKIATWPKFNSDALITCSKCSESIGTQSVFLHSVTHLQTGKDNIEQLLKNGNGRDIFLLARKFLPSSSPLSMHRLHTVLSINLFPSFVVQTYSVWELLFIFGFLLLCPLGIS